VGWDGLGVEAVFGGTTWSLVVAHTAHSQEPTQRDAMLAQRGPAHAKADSEEERRAIVGI
jgi:hypothetical protein